MWVEHKLFVVLYQKVLLEELSLIPDLTISSSCSCQNNRYENEPIQIAPTITFIFLM